MRIGINYKKITEKYINMQTLYNILLNNQCITEEIKEEIFKNLKTKENENTTIKKKLWVAEKAFLRGKFMAMQAILGNKKSSTNNVTLHLKELEKEEEIKSMLVEGKK